MVWAYPRDHPRVWLLLDFHQECPLQWQEQGHRDSCQVSCLRDLDPHLGSRRLGLTIPNRHQGCECLFPLRGTLRVILQGVTIKVLLPMFFQMWKDKVM